VDPFLISQLDTKVKEKNTIFNTVKWTFVEENDNISKQYKSHF